MTHFKKGDLVLWRRDPDAFPYSSVGIVKSREYPVEDVGVEAVKVNGLWFAANFFRRVHSGGALEPAE